jgi:hypothetical protein
MTAQDVLDKAAVLLNDSAKTIFTDAAMLPYLSIAQDELQEQLELNNVPMSNAVSAVIPITAGTDSIGDTGDPALPTNLIEPKALYERTTGTNDDFILMTKVEFLPEVVIQLNELIYWTWQGQIIKFLGALSNQDVKIEYVAAVLNPITATSTIISLFNAKTFLEYRTASLCAQFIGENKERADDLNFNAALGLDRILGITTKGRQSIATRRRPFLSGYKANW